MKLTITGTQSNGTGTPVDVLEGCELVSGNTAIANIVDGQIVGVSSGTTTIEVRLNGIVRVVPIEVYVPVPVIDALSFNRSTMPAALGTAIDIKTLAPYTQEDLMLFGSNADGSQADLSGVVLTSSDEGVLSVSGHTLTPVSTGTSIVYATSGAVSSYPVAVTVHPAGLLLTMEHGSMAMAVGQSGKVYSSLPNATLKVVKIQLSGTAGFDALLVDGTLTLSSGDEAVASISDGVISGVAPGSCAITARQGTSAASIVVVVTAE